MFLLTRILESNLMEMIRIDSDMYDCINIGVDNDSDTAMLLFYTSKGLIYTIFD